MLSGIVPSLAAIGLTDPVANMTAAPRPVARKTASKNPKVRAAQALNWIAKRRLIMLQALMAKVPGAAKDANAAVATGKYAGSNPNPPKTIAAVRWAADRRLEMMRAVFRAHKGSYAVAEAAAKAQGFGAGSNPYRKAAA